MVTADKSRFNRRRMYLISNEFTLPAFSGARPLLITEGFISLKRDLRELNIAEIPVEPRVRSNLIPGRARAGGLMALPWFSLLSLSPSPPSLRFALSATTPRIYLPYPLVTVRACIRSRREWGHRGNEPPCLTIFAYSQALPTICSGRRAAGKRAATVVARATLRENTAKKFVQNAVSTVVVFAVGDTKCRRYSDGRLPCG